MWSNKETAPVQQHRDGFKVAGNIILKEDTAMKDIYRQIVSLAQKYHASRIILFGSRARGDFRPTSDIDIAVYGMPQENRPGFWMEAEELPTLLKLDIVHVEPGMDQGFLTNIEKEGIILYAEDQ